MLERKIYITFVSLLIKNYIMMKKLFYCIVIVLLVTSCVKRSRQNREERIKTWEQTEIEKAPVVVRDGCEYLMFNTYSARTIFTHKGDCKNPIHYKN